MYTVEALIPDMEWSAGTVGFPRDEWKPIRLVPQGETEQEELGEARRLREMAERFYVSVRITKSVGDNRTVVI